MKTLNFDYVQNNKVFAWIAAATAGILLIPLIAMQFTNEVDWNAFDFIVMGALIYGMGSLFVLTARRVKSKNRALLAVAFALAFLYIWAELAVGVFTNIGS